MADNTITMTPSEFKELKHSEELMSVGFDALALFTDDSLEHHGVKDQKWGVKNGPPYPLNKEGKAKFEENVRKRKQAEKDGKARATNGDVKKEKAEPPKASIGGLFNNKKSSKSETEKADEEEKKKESSESKRDPEEAELDRLEKEEAEKKEPEQEKPKEMTPEERKKDMQDAVKSGDFERVQKYFSELTPDQINEAITRMDLQRTLKRYDPTPKERPQNQQNQQSDSDSDKNNFWDPSANKEYIKKRNSEAVANADWEFAQKHFDRFSDQDLEKLIKRVDYKKQINSNETNKSTMDKIDAVVKNLDKVNNWANSGIKWWNTAAKINNTFSENKWPMIDTNISTKFNAPANWASKLKAATNAKDDSYVENLKKAVNSLNNDSKSNNQSNQTQTQSKPNNSSNQSNQNSSATSTTSTTSTTSSNKKKKKHR